MKTQSLWACAVALFATILLPSFASAQANPKQTPARVIDVKKLFGFYDTYLRLPPAARDGFALAYILKAKEAGARPQFNYLLGNTRTPIQVAQSGKILSMPDANMLANGKVEIAAGQPTGSVTMDLEAIVPLSRAISVADASNPVNDFAAAIRSVGPAGLLIPKLPSLVFKGGAGGQALFPDGRRIALPAVPGGVKFTPNQPAMRGATTLAFPVAPSAAEFAR
jgi:hypothetical protein